MLLESVFHCLNFHSNSLLFVRVMQKKEWVFIFLNTVYNVSGYFGG